MRENSLRATEEIAQHHSPNAVRAADSSLLCGVGGGVRPSLLLEGCVETRLHHCTTAPGGALMQVCCSAHCDVSHVLFQRFVGTFFLIDSDSKVEQIFELAVSDNCFVLI